MPQSLWTRKTIALGIGLLLVAAPPALGGEEAAERTQLYVCGTGDDASEGTLELTGVAVAGSDGAFNELRVERLDANQQLLWSFAPGQDSRTAFRFAHSNGPEGYLVTVRFDDAGTSYTLYSLYNPPDPADPDDAGGASGGLVSARDGKLVADVECGESPYEFIDYMRQSMSCDDASPLGKAACDFAEPRRPAPLDIATIGLG